MSRHEARLATESHPRSGPHWRLTPEAIDQMVEQLPGKPVTANYDATRPPLGRVVSAEQDEVGVRVVMELAEVPNGLRTDEVGPGFAMLHTEVARDGSVRRIDGVKVFEVALLPPDPRSRVKDRTFLPGAPTPGI